MAKKKLSTHIPEELDDAFREEAEKNFRSLSDHMTAILSDRYGITVREEKESDEQKENS